jgi:hypothetical protein
LDRENGLEQSENALPVKRRDFVKTMAVAGTGLLLHGGRCSFAQDRQTQNPKIRRVLVMFKCHFDAGFIDTQHNVVQKYFTRYFPQAIEIARAANAGGRRRYVWTTGSWLVYEYLDRAQPAERRVMEDAIRRGDIAWHALPFSWQTEMLTPSLIEGSLALSKSLDGRFGTVTTGAKMTDVPGHTRGIVPPLAKHGVTFLEIGVNGGSTPAELPPIFLWKDPSGASLPMMYHHEYGGVACVPGSDLALVTCVRGDNSGPHLPGEIEQIYADLARQFPNAEIQAANLTEMANALAPYCDHLPEVTGEVGDTWIYGVASDPLKVARYRALTRLREAWIAKGAFRCGDATDIQLLRRALLEAEHTWGTDTKTWLDFENYRPADLERMLGTKNYKVVEYSWQEKRQDLFDGVAALPEALRTEARDAIESVKAVRPALPATKWPAGKPIETAHFVLEIDSRTGAITRLRNKAAGKEWAGATHPIALVTYQTLSQADYRKFLADYLTTRADWAAKDFGKPNIEEYGAASQEWHPANAAVYVEESARGHRVVVELAFQDEEAAQSGRAAFPRSMYAELIFDRDEPAIRIDISWFDKPATRMPEALWLTFKPAAEDQHGLQLHKCGEWISPFDVVVSGNRHMHALDTGLVWNSGGSVFSVETVDAPVVALGLRTPLCFSNEQPEPGDGIHSCLFNNAWGTNYIMWYGEDGRARYVLKA